MTEEQVAKYKEVNAKLTECELVNDIETLGIIGSSKIINDGIPTIEWICPSIRKAYLPPEVCNDIKEVILKWVNIYKEQIKLI